MAKNGRLRTPQRRAIESLLTADSVAQAADAAGVSKRTVYRWMSQDRDFKAALNEAQHKAIGAAVSRLSGEALAAVETLATIHADEETKPAVRVQAARAILSQLLRIREQHVLEERINALEESVQNGQI